MFFSKTKDAPSRRNPDNVSENDMALRALYRKIVSYMAEKKPYLEGDYTLEDLARKMFCSRTSASRAITYCSGRNFKQFLNWYRIQYAKELIRKDPGMKMIEVAHMSGFNTQPSFNLAFRMNTSCTPTRWRV